MKISGIRIKIDGKSVDLSDSFVTADLPTPPEKLHHQPAARRIVFEGTLGIGKDDAGRLFRLILYPMQTAWHSVN